MVCVKTLGVILAQKQNHNDGIEPFKWSGKASKTLVFNTIYAFILVIYIFRGQSFQTGLNLAWAKWIPLSRFYSDELHFYWMYEMPKIRDKK